MDRRLDFTFALVCSVSTTLAAPVPNPLWMAKALSCNFSAPATPASELFVTIRRINLSAHTAKLGERASVEHAATGSLIFTTVFAGPPEETEFYAVQSRHLTVMTGIPQLAQRVGTCVVAK